MLITECMFLFTDHRAYNWGACKRTLTVDVTRRQTASVARGVLSYIRHIDMCRPKQCGFSAVLV